MMLGDLLAAARSRSGEFQSWLEDSDPETAAAVAAAAAREALTPSQFVRGAVADFALHANEEDWATLTSSIRDSADPGTVCLLAMVNWRLTARGCGDHSFARPGQPEGAAHE
jgi:hypothetical protein